MQRLQEEVFKKALLPKSATVKCDSRDFLKALLVYK